MIRLVYTGKIINYCLNANSQARKCSKIILLCSPISYFPLIVKSRHCLVQFSWISYAENFNLSLLMISFVMGSINKNFLDFYSLVRFKFEQGWSLMGIGWGIIKKL